MTFLFIYLFIFGATFKLSYERLDMNINKRKFSLFHSTLIIRLVLESFKSIF